MLLEACYNVTDGRRGPMWVTDFVALLLRNSNRTDIRLLKERVPSSQNLAPKNTWTLTIGAAKDGWAYNVPTSQIPEFTIQDARTQFIVHRGWRSLLKMLLHDKVVRSTQEILDTLGREDFGRDRTVVL